MIQILAIGLVLGVPADPKIDDVFQKGFKDASFTATIDMSKQSELVKIKKEFGTQYRIKETKIWLKEPHKMRLEAKVEDTTVLYVINGTKKFVKVPRMRLSQLDDEADAPGKRQTFLDFGFFTNSMFTDPFAATYIRTDRQTGEYVFDINFKKHYENETRHRVWIDPEKKYTTKREWYAREGYQLATFLYSDPVNMGGIWFPTKCTVKNVDGKVAGVTSYRNLKVNTSLGESLFELK